MRSCPVAPLGASPCCWRPCGRHPALPAAGTGRRGRSGRAARRDRPGSRRDEPLPDRVLRRLGGVRSQLPGPRELRPERRADRRLRRSRGPRTGRPGRSRSTRTSSGRTASRRHPTMRSGRSRPCSTEQSADRGYVGVGYLDLYLTYAGVTSVTAPDPQTLVVETTDYPNTQILTSYLPILPKHIWEKRDINTDREQCPRRRDRPLPGRRVEDRRVRPVRPQPELPRAEVPPGRDLHPVLQGRGRDDRGPQDRRHRLRPERDLRPVRRR